MTLSSRYPLIKNKINNNNNKKKWNEGRENFFLVEKKNEPSGHEMIPIFTLLGSRSFHKRHLLIDLPV